MKYAILLAAVVGFIGFVVWDQVTMQERITKKYNAGTGSKRTLCLYENRR